VLNKEVWEEIMESVNDMKLRRNFLSVEGVFDKEFILSSWIDEEDDFMFYILEKSYWNRIGRMGGVHV
jgi:hypothetical protein